MADLLGPFAPQERISTRARNIRIEVRPDGTVLLVIPKRASRLAAHAFLRSREEWIRRKLVELTTRAASVPQRRPLQLDGGDTVPLHGTERPLRVVATRSAAINVRIEANAVTVAAPPAQLIHRALIAHRLRTALSRLARQESLALLEQEALRLGVRFEGPRIADQKSLWGSCTPDGLISLNWRLIMAPPEVLRYVAIHELCHRRHLDHSPRFWRLVERQMPDHARWRIWLREHGAGLHAVLPKAAPEPDPPGLFTDTL